MAETEIAPILRTFKFRLLPRKGQHDQLAAALAHTRELYNAALEERIDCYRKTGVARSYADQCKALTGLRTDPAFRAWSVKLQRWPLKALDAAFASFIKRVRRGGAPGFPRFKGAARFNTFGFSDRDGWSVARSRLCLQGIGRVRIHMHRPLPSAPVSCRVKRDGKGWVVLLVCAVEREALPTTGRQVGIDLGITSFVYTSDGEGVPGFKAGRRAHAEERRRQRSLARCKRGSSNRRKAKARLARLHERTANARRTFQHQVAARLVRENDLIAIENLNVKGLARGMLARDVNDAGWASFTTLLAEKAEKAARVLVKVDPRYTSQACSACGVIVPKPLKQRTHRCDCGAVLDRDHNAALNILRRAIASPLSLNVGDCAERAARNIGARVDPLSSPRQPKSPPPHFGPCASGKNP